MIEKLTNRNVHYTGREDVVGEENGTSVHSEVFRIRIG